ncbi:PfkB family carbohydrate kinase [Kinneretia aquatilis]|uniref:PfkB family carbohydrate kinase n=1 Tax=Kinneretia aquatilis TaxID=2070761 RepID=UPI001CBB1E0A|nr:PfkB family carbohydrate kinase [Paucibacter aquatile]WIW00288.1 PfkB family carbohydrate kinase [Paucibacter aquatile]
MLGERGELAYTGIGGSTGNVLSILAFLGWESLPLVNLGRDHVGATIHREFTKLGANMRHVRLDRSLTSPLLYQFAGEPTEAPRYSFACPVCGQTRRFHENLVDSGGEDFARCAAESNVFFFDRVTAGTVRMAQAARAGGAFVFFEPSSISADRYLFDAALSSAHVVKYSVDRIGEPLGQNLASGFIEIQTLGARGLRFRKHSLVPDWIELPALRSSSVADTSGAGDWCTAGFLHALFARREGFEIRDLSYNDIYRSLRLGQSIASLSVRHVGARGLMRAWQSSDALEMAQRLLDGAHAPEWTGPSFAHRQLGSVCCADLTSAMPQPGRLSTFF